MPEVSLDPYRTPGVGVFSGEDRGRLVAEAIIQEYGREVVITIPDDVFAITHTFWRGFFETLPTARIYFSERQLHMREALGCTLAKSWTARVEGTPGVDGTYGSEGWL